MSLDTEAIQQQPKEEEEEVGGLDDEPETELTLVPFEDKKPSAKTFKISKKDASLSKFITTILEGDQNATEININQVNAATLALVVEYLKQHKGVQPPEIQCPIRSLKMREITQNEWDADFIDGKDKKVIFEIILAANYMDIKPLLHLGCAKIATLIKKLDQNEINEIIKNEEEYRKGKSSD